MEAQKNLSTQISIKNDKDNWMEVQYTKILKSLTRTSDLLNLLEEADPSRETSATMLRLGNSQATTGRDSPQSMFPTSP